MSISSEVTRIKSNISDAYDACEDLGATMPQTKDSAHLANCINTIDTASISTLTITPTTSQQTITAPSGTDGYSPITVNAVTSAIDSNITASNIKNGVSILGVAGTYTPDLYIGKQITQNGTYTATNDNKDGYYSVVVAVGSSTAGITYTDTTISTTQALDTELGISSGNGISNQNVGATSYVLAQYSSQNQSYSYSVSNTLQASTNDIPVAKVKVSNSQITGIDMYVSGYDAEYDSSGVTPSNVGITYDSSNSTLTILANYLNDVLGYTFYTSDVTLTYNMNWGAVFMGNASTTDGQKSLTLTLNAYGNGSTTSYYFLQGREQIASANSSSEADFALTYSVSSGIVDTSSVTVTIYTTGWEYTPSGSGSGSGGSTPSGSAVTVDTTNNAITFSSAYMSDLTNGSVNENVVLTKNGASYNSSGGGLVFVNNVNMWGGASGDITCYFALNNNTINFRDTQYGGEFASASATIIPPSQENNWSGDMTIKAVTILSPANWVSS